MSICCFTGHREIPNGQRTQLYQALSEQLDRCLADGYTTFRAGGALGFDTLAAECVLEKKKDFPDIRLEIFVPHEGQERRWQPADRRRYSDILAKADAVHVLSDHYYRGCMFVRNRAMVDGADLCIAYLTKSTGGSKMTVDYAAKCGVAVCNLAEEL